MDISPDILRMHKFTPIGARSLACPPLPVPHEDYCVHFIRPNKTRLLNHKEFDVLTEDLRSCVDKDIKLNPPEIVYGDLDGTEEGADIKILMLKGHVPIAEVRLSPVDALRAWAKCHNGEVSILKGIDAEKWKEKKHTGELLGVTNLHHITTPDDMNFDWTFSTPYCGSVLDGKTDFTTELPCQTLNQSGIPIHLLTDTSQPIVLYEDCMFFEDDLHDVGDVFFNVKLRVMPKCWYVKMRFYLRVDNVKLRVRETRLFGTLSPSDTNNERVICRDIVWRDMDWCLLATRGLPTDVKEWRGDAVDRIIGKLDEVEIGPGGGGKYTKWLF